MAEEEEWEEEEQEEEVGEEEEREKEKELKKVMPFHCFIEDRRPDFAHSTVLHNLPQTLVFPSSKRTN